MPQGLCRAHAQSPHTGATPPPHTCAHPLQAPREGTASLRARTPHVPTSPASESAPPAARRRSSAAPACCPAVLSCPTRAARMAAGCPWLPSRPPPPAHPPTRPRTKPAVVHPLAHAAPPPARRARFTDDLRDDVADFSGEQFQELARWRDFYAQHQVGGWERPRRRAGGHATHATVLPHNSPHTTGPARQHDQPWTPPCCRRRRTWRWALWRARSIHRPAAPRRCCSERSARRRRRRRWMRRPAAAARSSSISISSSQPTHLATSSGAGRKVGGLAQRPHHHAPQTLRRHRHGAPRPRLTDTHPPPCAAGGWVWCTDGCYPRRVARPTFQGEVQEQCACLEGTAADDSRRLYDGCRADAQRCQTSAPEAAAAR